MTAKQVRYFGTKRQRAALKRRRRHNSAAPVKRRRTTSRKRNTATRRRRTRRSNPLVVTLGAINPRRKKSMARRRRTRSTSRRRRTRRNPVTYVTRVSRRRTYRRANTRRRVHHRRRHARRNPAMFGSRLSARNAGTMIAGGLVGVAVTKIIPRVAAQYVPLPTTGGFLMAAAISGISAFAAGFAAKKLVRDPGFGDAVLFGGLMQTGSILLNGLLPGFAIAGVPVALSGLGLGELMPGSFPVPQNPLLNSPTPRVTVNGLARAYGQAY